MNSSFSFNNVSNTLIKSIYNVSDIYYYFIKKYKRFIIYSTTSSNLEFINSYIALNKSIFRYLLLKH